MKKTKNTAEITATEKLAMKTEGFFARNIKWLIAIAVIIVIAVIAVAVATIVIGNNNEKKLNAVYSLEQNYNNLMTLDDTTSEYTSAVDSFLASADELIANGGDSYPVVKAEYLKGLYYAYVEDYSNALTAFEDVAAKSADTYFGPLALMNAAAVAEDGGDQNKALEYYNRVWDDYGTEASESPKALFNIGRIYEAQGDTELAKATYQQLVDQYSSSSEYAKLASSRIVLL